MRRHWQRMQPFTYQPIGRIPKLWGTSTRAIYFMFLNWMSQKYKMSNVLDKPLEVWLIFVTFLSDADLTVSHRACSDISACCPAPSARTGTKPCKMVRMAKAPSPLTSKARLCMAEVVMPVFSVRFLADVWLDQPWLIPQQRWLAYLPLVVLHDYWWNGNLLEEHVSRWGSDLVLWDCDKEKRRLDVRAFDCCTWCFAYIVWPSLKYVKSAKASTDVPPSVRRPSFQKSILKG